MNWDSLEKEFEKYLKKKYNGDIDQKKENDWAEFLTTVPNDGSYTIARAVEDTAWAMRDDIVRAVQNGNLARAQELAKLQGRLSAKRREIGEAYQRNLDAILEPCPSCKFYEPHEYAVNGEHCKRHGMRIKGMYLTGLFDERSSNYIDRKKCYSKEKERRG